MPTEEECAIARAQPVSSGASAPHDGFFLPGEVQLSMDMHLSGYTVPASRTTYRDFALKFSPPECVEQTCYIVGIDALVDRVDLVHHYVLDGCSEDWADDKHGETASAWMASCEWFLGGWAPGREPMLKNPGYAANAFGGTSGTVLKGFSLQMHYDNPYGVKGAIDKSGIRVYYTTTPRAYEADTFKVFEQSRNPAIKLPPGQQRYHLTKTCKMALAEPINLVEIGGHGHLLGREMYLELYRHGKRVALFSESTWHFDDQYTQNVEGRHLKLYNGDQLVATCVYDTTERLINTPIGLETTDEMCWSTFTYYPRQNWMSCKGEDWHGALSQEESGHLIFDNHRPWNYFNVVAGAESDAPVDWDTPPPAPETPQIPEIPETPQIPEIPETPEMPDCASAKKSKSKCKALGDRCEYKKKKCTSVAAGPDCASASNAKACKKLGKSCKYLKKKKSCRSA